MVEGLGFARLFVLYTCCICLQFTWTALAQTTYETDPLSSISLVDLTAESTTEVGGFSSESVESVTEAPVDLLNIIQVVTEQRRLLTSLQVALNTVQSRQAAFESDLVQHRRELLAECRMGARREAAGSVTTWLGSVDSRFENLTQEVGRLKLSQELFDNFMHAELSRSDSNRPGTTSTTNTLGSSTTAATTNSPDDYNSVSDTTSHGPPVNDSARSTLEERTNMVEHNVSTMANMERRLRQKMDDIHNMTQKHSQSIDSLQSLVESNWPITVEQLSERLHQLNNSLSEYVIRAATQETKAHVFQNQINETLREYMERTSHLEETAHENALALNATLESYSNKTLDLENETRGLVSLCALDTSNAIALVQQFINETEVHQDSDRRAAAAVQTEVTRLTNEIAALRRSLGSVEVALSESSASQSRATNDLNTANTALSSEVQLLKMSSASSGELIRQIGERVNTAHSGLSDLNQSLVALQGNTSSIFREVAELHSMEGALARLFELNRLNSEKVVYLMEQAEEGVSLINGLANTTYSLHGDLDGLAGQVAEVVVQVTENKASLAHHQRVSNASDGQLKERVDMLRGRYRVLDNRLAHVEVNYLREELSLCQQGVADIRQSSRLDELAEDLLRLNTDLNQTTAVTLHLEQSLVTFAQRERSQEQAMERIISGWRELEQRLPVVTSLQQEVDKLLSDVPQDCTVAYSRGSSMSGRYLVRPRGSFATISVQCDMSDGGWTLLQNRFDGSVSFNHDWATYGAGFGNIGESIISGPGDIGEFWLGNANINLLTTQGNYTARFDLWDTNGTYRHADYELFQIGDADSLYRLVVGGYSGNATDSLSRSAGMSFSTPERDNDRSSTNCAHFYTAGWWYAHCHYCNLNGRFSYGMVWFDHDQDSWVELVRTRIRIRRNDVG